MGEEVEHLSLKGHRGASGVLLQSFDYQGLEQTNVVVDGVLETKTRVTHQISKMKTCYDKCLLGIHKSSRQEKLTLSPRWRVALAMLDLSW